MLMANNDEMEETLYISWFSVAINAMADNEPFANHAAWAAAVEYVWRKQQGMSVTQKSVAAKYHVSPSTVQKYVKRVRSLLP
jgi:hypothetical protein